MNLLYSYFFGTLYYTAQWTQQLKMIETKIKIIKPYSVHIFWLFKSIPNFCRVSISNNVHNYDRKSIIQK